MVSGVSISRRLVRLASYSTPIAAEHLIGEHVACTRHSPLNVVSPLMGKDEEQLFARQRRVQRRRPERSVKPERVSNVA